jgi:HEAT repeat protein
MLEEEKDIRELMEELVEDSEAISFSRLYALSDLARERWAAFYDMWQLLSILQRRRLIQALVDLAEASFQVNFDAIFRYCMQDPDPEVRAAAINGLWENEEPNLIGPLIGALRSDPSAQVRAAAATGLGRYVLAGELEQLEPPIQARVMEELMFTVHLAGESVEVRRRAIESAAYACTPEALDALEMAYYDEDADMRLSAIVGMGHSCDMRWQDILLAELQSNSPAMRYEAALATGELMLRKAVPLLARLIEDADPQIRDASIWALGQIGGQQAKDVLLDAYEDADEDMLGVHPNCVGN